MDKKIYQEKSIGMFDILLDGVILAFFVVATVMKNLYMLVIPIGLLISQIKVFSEKVEIDYEKKEIIHRIFWIAWKRVDITKIKRYFLKEHRNKFATTYGIATFIEMELLDNGKTFFKNMDVGFFKDKAEDIFAEARKINKNIIRADQSFHPTITQRPISQKVSLMVLLIIGIAVVILFFNNLKNL